MASRTYTIGELKQLIAESAGEKPSDFKPKMFKNGTDQSKQALNKAKNNAKTLGSSLQEGDDIKDLPARVDDNKTTVHTRVENVPTEKEQETVEAQIKGLPSTLASTKDHNADYSGNERFLKNLKKDVAEKTEKELIAKTSGLTSKELKDRLEAQTMVKTTNESKHIAVLNFKGTTFLNEEHMISRIPDDYKVDGQRFKMRDASDNEFIVEWNEGEANILSYENKTKLNESIAKMKRLSNYMSSDQFKKSSPQSRLNETKEFSKILDRTRNIMNK